MEEEEIFKKYVIRIGGNGIRFISTHPRTEHLEFIPGGFVTEDGVELGKVIVKKKVDVDTFFKELRELVTQLIEEDWVIYDEYMDFSNWVEYIFTVVFKSELDGKRVYGDIVLLDVVPIYAKYIEEGEMFSLFLLLRSTL